MALYKNICAFIALIFVILYIITPLGLFNRTFCAVGFMIAALVLFIFFRVSNKLFIKNKWVKPSNIFIASLAIVGFQLLMDYFLGIKSVDGALYPYTLNKCLCLSIVALSSFVFGYSLKSLKYQNGMNCRDYYFTISPKLSLLSGFQLVCLILFVTGFGFSNLISGASYVGGNDAASGTLGTYGEMFLFAANIAIVVLTSSSKSNVSFWGYLRRFPKLSMFVFVIYILIRLFSGDRGPVIYNCLLLLFGYLYTSRKSINALKTILLCFVAITLINVVGIARQFDSNMSITEKYTDAFDAYNEGGRYALSDDFEGSCFPPTAELAGSFKISEIAVNNIHGQGDIYTLGLLQVVQILNAIPFSYYVYSNLIPLRPEYLSSSARANYCFFHGYDRNYGIGTNMIADFFWDFGVFGVFIFMMLTGMIFYRVDNVLVGSERDFFSPMLLCLALANAAEALYIPRATLLMMARIVIYPLLLVYLFGGIKKTKAS